ncbi:hypothetical protein PRNP1_004995 [Phytophthora ramorum]
MVRVVSCRFMRISCSEDDHPLFRRYYARSNRERGVKVSRTLYSLVQRSQINARGNLVVCEEMKETAPKGMSEASAVPTDVNQVPRHLAPVKSRLKCNTAGRKKELRQEGKVTARATSGRKVTTNTNTNTRASRLIKSSTSGKAAITNMQRSMDRYMQNVKPTTAQQALSNAPEPDMADASQRNDSDIVDSTPDSQDEVVAGTTRTGTAPGDQDSPIQHDERKRTSDEKYASCGEGRD